MRGKDVHRVLGIKRNVHGSVLTGMHLGKVGLISGRAIKATLSAFSLSFKKAPAVSGNGASHCGGKGMTGALSATARKPPLQCSHVCSTGVAAFITTINYLQSTAFS